MYCPKCGTPDQTSETFCRQCGIFLPDLNNVKAREAAPELHIKSNAALSLMTIAAAITIGLLLYSVFNGRGTPVLIYLAASLLFAISAWQIQMFWRTMLLRRQLKKNMPGYSQKSAGRSGDETSALGTGKLLNEADFENYIQASVTDPTTRNLSARKKRST